MLTRHERLVLIVFMLILLIGSMAKFIFRRYPWILEKVGVIENDVLYLKVDLNTASFEELLKVPYIGRRSAERIIRYRMQRGAFKKVEDLRFVEGINEKLLERIHPFVCINSVQ
ncbi:MAG: helix-hairpin-helix domain-containing protein [Candidatus Omnitrophica bacterium]|nr:helix-hairpin-helix domain-containing protein [Candidatus Omnitrophota bacterium]